MSAPRDDIDRGEHRGVELAARTLVLTAVVWGCASPRPTEARVMSALSAATGSAFIPATDAPSLSRPERDAAAVTDSSDVSPAGTNPSASTDFTAHTVILRNEERRRSDERHARLSLVPVAGPGGGGLRIEARL